MVLGGDVQQRWEPTPEVLPVRRLIPPFTLSPKDRSFGSDFALSGQMADCQIPFATNVSLVRSGLEQMIAWWSGPVETIPDNWILCDGTLGTPDLRNEFIVGAGDTYAVDESGGTTQHDHNFTSDGHDHEVNVPRAFSSGTPYHENITTETDTANVNASNHLSPYHALLPIMRI